MKMKIHKKNWSAPGTMMALASLLLFSLMPFVKAAEYGSLQAYGVDTVAGYSALLSTSKTTPSAEIVIAVRKPGGTTVTIPATTNEEGVARVDLYDYHTRRAGTYSVMAYPKGQAAQGALSYFDVYPDEVSPSHSSVAAQTGVARATGKDPVYITVTLRDQYGNPFQGHQVHLLSSRPGDRIASSLSGALTDVNGSATFSVTSSVSGVSVFSAIDSTSGTVVDSRAQVAFLSADSYLDNVGGDFTFIPLANAQGAGPLNHFAITGIPGSVEPNQNVSFTVTAQDQDDLTVENYTGTVRFSTEGAGGNNVTLPEDYTFKAEDLGTHQFSLGLKFSTAGTYTIVATDTSNTLIRGETTVVVGGGAVTPSSGTQAGQKPSILTPVAGSYSNNVQNISGSAPAGSTVKIFDNDQEIGSVQVGPNGSYSYQTAPLSDGEHSIYVVTVDASNTVLETSDTVLIIVDTTPPAVDDVIIEPTSVATGEIMTVKVMSEPNLSESAIIFNNEIIALSPSLDQDGMYVASLQAPAEPGEYPLDILLVDELGNEQTYEDQALITISADGTAQVTEETVPPAEVLPPAETPAEEMTPPAGNPPTQVFGVIPFGSDKRVTLVWEAATDADGLIDHYKIYYGLNPANLDLFADTLDASTTWYIPNLENGKEYFFAVAAVDDAGLESATLSELVNAIPFTLEVETALPERPETALGALTEEALLRGAALGAIPPEMTKNGPEVLWLLLGTGAASGLVRTFSRRKRRVR